MAELRKITRNPSLSNFSQEGPTGATALLALADMAQDAYKMMLPEAQRRAGALGADEGAELARRQIGQTEYPKLDYSTPGGLADFTPSGKYRPDASLAGKIVETAHAIGADPEDLATAISYETGGTFDPLQKGPTTQWGQHIGLIQFGEPQRKQYGLDLNNPVDSQLGANGAIARYFRDRGFKPGMSGLDLYSTINAGRPGRYSASDANNGGAPGDVRDKWENQTGPHREKARALLAGLREPSDAEVAAMPEAATYVGEITAPEPSAPERPTLVQTASGAIEPRMFNPLGGPISQAYNAAASSAYLAEMMVKGSTDMLSMSEQYIGDPSGFQQAAQSYIDQAVKDVPEMMRADLRAQLSQGAQRRMLGMVEENHREIRQRADNSSRALVDRFTDEYAQILASGDMDMAAGARAQLEDALLNREAMPGVAWTRQQSENIILGAQERARTIAEQNATKVKTAQAGQLRTIIAAAEKGLSAEDEAILDDPAIHANHPVLAAEAAGKVALRELMPGFFSLPPAQMDAQIAEVRNQPIGDAWEVDIVGAMEAVRSTATKGLEADPIAYAAQRFQRKPPAIEAFDGEDVGGFVASLQARADFAREMVAQGYTRRPVYLSKPEVESLSALLSAEAPVDVRSAAAGAIVSGFGQDAGRVLSALNADGVTAWGGMLRAKGGSTVVAEEALRGQQALAERTVQTPDVGKWQDALNAVRPALAGLPVDPQVAEGQVLKFAQAIYAARSMTPGFAADEATMTEAVQAALGQSKGLDGDPIGGVQALFGSPTLMPPNVNAQRVEELLEQGMWSYDRSAVETFGLMFSTPTAAENPGFWAKVSTIAGPDGTPISGGVPYVGGEPLRLKMFRDKEITFVPEGGTVYRMELRREGGKVLDVHTQAGSRYRIDLGKLQ